VGTWLVDVLAQREWVGEREKERKKERKREIKRGKVEARKQQLLQQPLLAMKKCVRKWEKDKEELLPDPLCAPRSTQI
jgi:hypothetical protein